MKKMLVLISLCLTLISPTIAHASTEFSTAFTSTYTISQDGSAQVLHKIDITNRLAHIYTTEYTLSVGSDRIESITSLVEGKLAATQVNQNGASTTITLTIPEPVIGYGQTTHLEISYRSPDIASVLGDTMTVNIPRMSKANEAESFTRVVRLPANLAPLNSTSPGGYTERLEGEERVYTFAAHPSESVTMLFGDQVTYQLNLSYEINNPTVTTKDTEIALPPDTPYQQILLSSLEPTPELIRVDSDGNWLARYSLKAQEKRTIQAELYATVTSIPTFFDPSSHGSGLTASKQYWDTHASSVSELAKQLKNPQNIYNYLVENFTYNYSRVKVGTDRLGAQVALANPTDTLCTEFTDTFIALARSAGVPAREINGYAYSQNQTLRPLGLETDILHSWPEYYNAEKKQWISVDPTWGNTTGGVNYYDKLDFNHIAFVRRGAESSYPLPAGVYKTDAKAKQIQVEVAKVIPEKIETLETKGDLIINTGNVGIVSDEVGYLPPYGQRSQMPSLTVSRPSWPVIVASLVGIGVLSGVVFFLRRKK